MRLRPVPSLALLLVLGAACTAPQESSTPAAPFGARPSGADVASSTLPEEPRDPRMGDLYDPLAPPSWTDAYENRSVLVADHVRVQGPPGLITHCVVQQDASRFTFTTETTPDGLLQRTVRRLEDAGPYGIRVQLDGLQIMAMGSMEVLESPNPIEVVVFARGEAWWRDPATGAEHRGMNLRLTGSGDPGGTEEGGGQE